MRTPPTICSLNVTSLASRTWEHRVRTVRSGFTLIELLVVIAILAILVSLLLPALANAKSKACSARCRGNQRNLGIAFHGYLSDNDGCCPTGTIGEGIGVWQQYLLPYTASNYAVFYDVAGIHAQSNYVKLIQATSSDVFPHYGLNPIGAVLTNADDVPLSLGVGGQLVPGGLVSTYKPLRETAVQSGSDFIVLGDTDGYVKPLFAQHIDANDLYYVGLPFNAVAPGKETIGFSLIGNWHSGGANMMFFDGHVEYAKQAVWTAANDAARRRWNYDHEPHSEYWGGH